jgi:hypothetical protein
MHACPINVDIGVCLSGDHRGANRGPVIRAVNRNSIGSFVMADAAP